MKGLRSIPRILKINEINGFEVSCLFNNGESRVIDFLTLFDEKFQVKPGHPAYELRQDPEAFKQIEIIGTTLGWRNAGIYTEDEAGNPVFDPYDIDPLVLYQNSRPDTNRDPGIGQMIRKERKKPGLTQQELAKKSGTTKHYISRLENNRTDIELLTLKKIVEAGLGKKLRILIS